MKSTLTASLLFLTITFHAQWNLVWSDEFDGNSLDPSKWTSQVGGWGWGNNELQYYTNGNNITVANGMLTIEAREEQVGGNDYTSARIYTKDLFEFQYGRVEARILFPLNQALWPAFWMLGANIDEVSWPYCGEIDIMEHVNYEWAIHGTAHWEINGHAYYGNSVNLYPSDFHVYAIEWDDQAIRWFLDGVEYHVMDISGGINGTSEFHNDFFLILNMAVGGNWPGYPDKCTELPDELVIDYVRVYQQ